MRLLPPPRLFPLLAAGLALAACDFTPVLDIELPEHERAIYLTGVVAADSTVAIGAGVSRDPYRYDTPYYTAPDAVRVLLRRDGMPDEILRQVQVCDTFTPEGTPTGETAPCGDYASLTRLRVGETVQFLASSPGLPDAVATVTVPQRPDVALGSVTRVPAPNDFQADSYDVRFEIADAVGPAPDRYGVSTVYAQRQPDYNNCDAQGNCAEITVTRPLRFTSSDVLLLSAGRALPDDGFRFVAFEDDLFSGETRSFQLEAEGSYSDPQAGGGERVRLRVAALSERLYEAYSLTAFSLGADGENPFAEVVDLPSNVEGGYGIIGAIAVWEAALDAE